MFCGSQAPIAHGRRGEGANGHRHELDAAVEGYIARPSSLALPIAQAEWIERFAARILARDAGETRDSLRRLALQLWPRQALLLPERAADAEYAQWPAPADANHDPARPGPDHGDDPADLVMGFSAG